VKVSGREAEITNSEVGALKGFGEHASVTEVLPSNLPVPVKAQVQEVEHLRDNWCGGLGEVQSERVLDATEVVCNSVV
jgi:hypothetical protein